MEDCGLDPNKTMDFALFQDVHVPFMFPKESQESVARTVKSKQSDDIKRPPPLTVTFYSGRRNLYAFPFGLRSRPAIYLVVLYLIREIHVMFIFCSILMLRYKFTF
jgi:hypothetical protein